VFGMIAIWQAYRVFHGFWQAKFAYGGLVFKTIYILLPKLPLKMMLILKVVKID
jgi:hypothetical protein